MTTMTREELEEYRRIAWAYYKDCLTQKEIAEKMNTNRQRVNRILAECLERGIVRIEISGAETPFLELESRLRQRYKLREARIIRPGEGEDLLESLGRESAAYLQSQLQDGDIVACTRGKAVAAVAAALGKSPRKDLSVVQLMGGWNSSQDGEHDMDEVVHRMAEQLGAKAEVLFAPILLKKASAKQILVDEPSFRDVYEKMKNTKIALVGIGDMTGKQFYKELLEEESFRGQGKTPFPEQAVGEIATHFFDREGRILATGFEDRTIAIRLQDYLNIPLRIGVAVSAEKSSAMEGALRGGLINALVTDQETARTVLANS